MMDAVPADVEVSVDRLVEYLRTLPFATHPVFHLMAVFVLNGCLGQQRMTMNARGEPDELLRRFIEAAVEQDFDRVRVVVLKEPFGRAMLQPKRRYTDDTDWQPMVTLWTTEVPKDEPDEAESETE